MIRAIKSFSKTAFKATTFIDLTKKTKSMSKTKFWFSTQSMQKINKEKSPYYFYFGWLKKHENIEKFEKYAQHIKKGSYLKLDDKEENKVQGKENKLQDKENKLQDKELLKTIINQLNKVENILISITDAQRKKNQGMQNTSEQWLQFKKWELKRQLRKAILFNLKDISQNQMTLKEKKIKGALTLIKNIQAKISRDIVEHISELTNVQKVNINNSERDFMKDQSFNQEIIELIDKKFEDIRKKNSEFLGQKDQIKEIKDYILADFRCLFDLSAEVQNYNQNQIQNVQERYSEGMIKGQIVFSVTPVTAEVFRFIFESSHGIDSISATKRIGKSHAVLLARILYSFYANDHQRLLIFENLMEFQEISRANNMLARMIRNCLHDKLKRKDFQILNTKFLEDLKTNPQINKKLKKQQLNRHCQEICLKINDFQKQFTVQQKKNKQKNNKQVKQAEAEQVKEKNDSQQQNIMNDEDFFNVQNEQALNLIHFQNLLQLIQDKKDSGTLILDQFNYPSRLLYQILALKLKGSASKQIIQAIKILALIKNFIKIGSSRNYRFLSSIHNFAFQKLISFMGLKFTDQQDSYIEFGYYFTGSWTKYQLQFELKKIIKNLPPQQIEKNKSFYQKIIKKQYIQKLVQQIPYALSGQGIRLLATTLINEIMERKNNKLNDNQILSLAQLKSVQQACYWDKFNVQTSLNKFFVVQQFSIDTQILKAYHFLKVANLFMYLKRRNKDTFNYKQFEFKRIQAYFEQGKKFIRRKPQQFPFLETNVQLQKVRVLATFLDLLKFYFIWRRPKSLLTFHKGYLQCCVELMKSCEDWTIKTVNIDKEKYKILEKYYQLFQYNKLKYKKQMLSIGIQMQISLNEVFQIFQKTEQMVFFANQNQIQKRFKINKVSKLQKKLTLDLLKKQLKRFIKDAQISKQRVYTQVITLCSPEKAKDLLIFISQNINNKLEISIYFSQIGINGKKKLNQGIPKFLQQFKKKQYSTIQLTKDYLPKNIKLEVERFPKFKFILLIKIDQQRPSFMKPIGGERLLQVICTSIKNFCLKNNLEQSKILYILQKIEEEERLKQQSKKFSDQKFIQEDQELNQEQQKKNKSKNKIKNGKPK